MLFFLTAINNVQPHACKFCLRVETSFIALLWPLANQFNAHPKPEACWSYRCLEFGKELTLTIGTQSDYGLNPGFFYLEQRALLIEQHSYPKHVIT